MVGKEKNELTPITENVLKPPVVSAVEELKAKVAKERAERIRNCEVAVREALTKFNCSLDVAMIITHGNVQSEIRIVSNKEQ